MKTYIGIDVGKTGGVAILFEDGTLELHKIPVVGVSKPQINEHELNRILSLHNGDESIYALENVTSIRGASAGSNFTFGDTKGLKRGMLVGMGVRFVMVAPKEWQKVAWNGIPVVKKANGRNDTKAISLLASQRIFPGQSFLATPRSSVPHDGLIDAALIAYYLKTKNL
jgi:hypothetical protein